MRSARAVAALLRRCLSAAIVATLLAASACTLSPRQDAYTGQPLPSDWLRFPPLGFDGSVPPRFVSGMAPIYPIRDALDGKPGFVIVRYTIGVDGRVHDARVLDASSPYFGNAVLDVMHGWVFKPAAIHGVPVPFRLTQPMHFSSD